MSPKGYFAFARDDSFESAPRFESKTYYGMDSITAALHELEAAMKRDPLCTIWALPGILERDEPDAD